MVQQIEFTNIQSCWQNFLTRSQGQRFKKISVQRDKLTNNYWIHGFPQSLDPRRDASLLYPSAALTKCKKKTPLELCGSGAHALGITGSQHRRRTFQKSPRSFFFWGKPWDLYNVLCEVTNVYGYDLIRFSTLHQ